MCIVRTIKEQEELRVMTSSDRVRAAVLDWPAEISRSEIMYMLIKLSIPKK